MNGGRGVVEFCWEKADVALRARVGIYVFVDIVGVGFSSKKKPLRLCVR